jgi:hypothetical protein
MQDKPRERSKQQDFGIFYPLGYIVVAFPKREDALRVQKDLLSGGYEPDDCVVYNSEEVASAAAQNLKENAGWLATLGKSDEAVQAHLNAAKKGAAFMLIYAPDDTEVERAMNVVRRVPFELAHRYRRFAIEDMK